MGKVFKGANLNRCYKVLGEGKTGNHRRGGESVDQF